MSFDFNEFLVSVKNGEIISNLIDKNISLRTQFGDTCFSSVEVEEFFKSMDINWFEIRETNNDYSYAFYNVLVDYFINGQHYKHGLLFKIFYNNNLISKMYITIDDNKKVKRIKCIVSYDGSKYYGYQKQPLNNTVQEEIEKVLSDIHQADITIYSSGRTDKGVHANNQVFHFDSSLSIEPSKWKSILNTYLSDYIYIKETLAVDKTFHSRFDTLSKEYLYKINLSEYNPIQKDYELYAKDVDIKIFTEQASKLIGEHDFRSFSKVDSKKDTNRIIYDVKVVIKENYLYFYIKGNGFMRYMVRNIVGALLDISTKKNTLDIMDIMNAKSRNSAKNTAFAGGLYLNEVKYN
ncbi:tRNA pseudouridine(38-40) synthase TruA [Candidatus Izimaplasma bacterium ZiA1]|uniref:tRNA pseudouridine(38-40) synthase TruA n=1 Tax=Candidatus Izimoplasma sp. ZiA1 TaxID=2024899 RepID=UPI000BAA616F|nr:tRNA pseudouridine(38-40) synthase TruA [Candidatus Izimaplasma bacterium ZiA1]